LTDLFDELTHRLEANARRAVDIYLREVPEYRAAAGDLAAATLDFAIFIRRRTLRCAAAGEPLSDDDLAMIHATGRKRGEHRLSLAAQRHALSLHTTLMLRDFYEAATPATTEDLLRLVGWLGQQGIPARRAYLDGYLSAVGNSWSLPARVALLAKALLADEPIRERGVMAGADDQFGLGIADHYLVTVIETVPPALPEQRREQVVETLLATWRVPMVWTTATELVIMTPDANGTSGFAASGGGLEVPDPLRHRTMALVRCVAAETGRAVAVGAATGHAGALAEALTLARKISQVAPAERVPHDLHTMTDRFVELSLAQAPQVDNWLRRIVEQLEAGPELVRTLDEYYRNDMSRAATAAALRIHTRTLDYRLQRVRDLTGLRPGSTRGVRVLTAAIMRAQAGR
jgi:PucR C-terminal helix-turn-helix domain